MNIDSKYPECELLYHQYWLATHVYKTMSEADFFDWINEYCANCKYMSEICMYGEEI